MKKALKLFLVFAVVATAFSSTALADVTVGAWGRALWSPVTGGYGVVDMETGDFEAVNAPSYNASWGGNGRIGFTVKGDSDNVGFQVDIKADSALELNDQQKIWVKPNDMFRVEIGRTIFYDKYRGNATFGAWDWLRFGGMAGEDVIFRRVCVGDGAMVEVSPMPALSIFAAFGDTSIDYGHSDTYGSNAVGVGEKSRLSTAEMIAYGQYGAGFDFGMGVARVQYLGKPAGAPEGVFVAGTPEYDEDDVLTNGTSGRDADDYGVINAAVKLDRIMPNLYVDLGVFYPTNEDYDNTVVAAYVKYSMGTIAVHALGRFELDKADFEGEEGLAIHGGLGLDAAAAGLDFNVDVRYSNNVHDGGEEGAMGFLAGVKKGFSNGLIGAGVQATTGTMSVSNLTKEKEDDMVWALPIRAEYWF